MAMAGGDYTTLFSKNGKIIYRIITQYNTLVNTTLPGDLAAIIAQYGTASTTYGTAQGPITGLTNTYSSMQSAVTGWRTGLLQYISNTYTDYDTVVSKLSPIPASNIGSVLPAIITDMSNNSQSVKANVVTVGSVTAGSANIGNGTVLVDKVLDGYNIPVSGGFSHIKYNGINSELAVPSETMVFTCTRDSFSGGATEGSEGFSWVGGTKFGQFDYHNEGSGTGPGLTVAHGVTLLSNLGFTTWSGSTPSSWTITAGSSMVSQETSNIYRMGSALKITGDGTTAAATLTQGLAASKIQSRRRYCLTFRICRGAVVPGGTNLTINFTGTGYTAAGSEQISVALGSLNTSYTLYNFYINMPTSIPSDFALKISVAGTPNNGSTFFIDSGSFSPVQYFGGVSAVLLSGNTAWSAGDTLSVPVSNDQGGKFQDFMRRWKGCQLPSKTDGSQTISDGLVTS